MGAAQRGSSARRPKWVGLLAVVLVVALGGLYRAGTSPATSALLLQPEAAPAAEGGSTGGGGRVPAEGSSSGTGEPAARAAPADGSSRGDEGSETAVTAAPADGGSSGDEGSEMPMTAAPADGSDEGSEQRDDGRDIQDAASTAALSLDAAARARSAGATAAAELAAPSLERAGGDDGSDGMRLPRPPKVALLFLTRGPLPFNKTWDWWLNDVDGALPSHSVGFSSRGVVGGGGWRARGTRGVQ